MGHKTLADKLDQIQREDLGIHFDESLLWEDLSASLGEKKSVLVERRLLIAACITLLILLFPIVLIMDSKPTQLTLESNVIPEQLVIQEALIEEPTVIEKVEETEKTPIYKVEKKGLSIELANRIELAAIDMRPIPIIKKDKLERQSFADQDISIIQASLGTPSIGKEKSVSLRAQLHTSSQPVQLNNKAFKIKLFDKLNH